MADRNRNGIDDALERKQSQQPKVGFMPPLGLGIQAASSFAKQAAPTLARMGIAAGLAQKVASNQSNPNGLKPKAEFPAGAAVTGASVGGWGAQPQSPEEPQKTLADYLAMAQEIVGGNVGGGPAVIPGVNFDPQRNTLRQNASENDSRLEAMYRQLRGSIDADAPVLKQGYQQAIDATGARTQAAQTQTQAASDAAADRNMEVLRNLGIEEAQGNIIQQGTDLASQTARQVADQASRGQIAGDQLQSNQQTAIQHNTNIGNAAGLEGNLQRAQNQAKLQALLSQIDMEEQTTNAGINAQNAQARSAYGQNNFSTQLQLAQQLMGSDVDERRYQDTLAQNAMQIAAKQATQEQPIDPSGTLELLNQLIQNGFLSTSDDPRQQVENLNAARRLYGG